MNLRQAAQRALKAMEDGEDRADMIEFSDALIALRAALAEPEQEPVRLQCTTCGTVYANGVPPQVPEHKPQTTHWEGCEAVHPECRKPEQEPMATKQMLRWVEHLKRLSDDGQHMSIPGLSSGACWELAIELEQFIKNTAPTPRKPLTEGEMRECAQAMNAEPLAEGWPELIKFARAIERAHGITGEQHE